jgi:hypothetical protein
MSQASSQSFISQVQDGTIALSNEVVWRVLSEMPLRRGTIYGVIEVVAGGAQMGAAAGNRLSAPVIRALSEGASSGRLDDRAYIINVETGQRNTVYEYLDVPRTAKRDKPTWKEKFEALEAKYKDLATKYEVACNSIDRLTARDLP